MGNYNMMDALAGYGNVFPQAHPSTGQGISQSTTGKTNSASSASSNASTHVLYYGAAISVAALVFVWVAPKTIFKGL